MSEEEFIFNMYKDKVIIAKTFKRDIKKNFKLDQREIQDLYVRINNYQVNKYGVPIGKSTIFKFYPEDIKRIRNYEYSRRYYKRNKEEIDYKKRCGYYEI